MNTVFIKHSKNDVSLPFSGVFPMVADDQWWHLYDDDQWRPSKLLCLCSFVLKTSKGESIYMKYSTHKYIQKRSKEIH